MNLCDCVYIGFCYYYYYLLLLYFIVALCTYSLCLFVLPMLSDEIKSLLLLLLLLLLRIAFVCVVCFEDKITLTNGN